MEAIFEDESDISYFPCFPEYGDPISKRKGGGRFLC